MATASKKPQDEKKGMEPIAILGIGCRYPGVSNPAELWQLLMESREAVGSYPGGRFAELDRMYEETGRGPGRILNDRGGFLADIAGFDAQFFEISPRESIYVDPQHRLLLEVAWEALEDAGQVRERYTGSATGVYVGLWTSEYENRLYESATDRDFYSITGCGRASASGRVSFTLGLQGPSVTVDSACSSSLVAMDMACRALQAGEIDMALAGGANAILGPEITELFTTAKMLSPDGRCKFGDASADGFVRSEGAGMVVLKRLSQALADKDPIYAVIRGSAVNNDGHTSGFLTPSNEGQQQMLRAAWKAAEVDPKDIRYIEMHGTGTSVGDPVEIGSVGAVLAESGVTRACVLGSVKTNLGHTESASGVTGLIKAALVMQHRMVPRSLHFSVPNPKIAWEKIPVRIAAEPVDLSRETEPLLAGVNSFGLSGTNAHVVLEAVAQEIVEASSEVGPFLLPVSARNPEALRELLREHLEALGRAENSVADVCYTAGARRTHHEHRAAIVGADLAGLKENLTAAVAGDESDGVVLGRAGAGAGKVVFVAPGQGSQWPGMARELFETNLIFRQAFEQCDAAIAAETGWRLSARLLGAEAERWLAEIDVIQPALFAMSVALAAVWRGWGIEPDAVVGHSMGEVAAAHLAEVLNLEDAVAVICRRSRLMKTLGTAGAMATVELPLKDVEALLRGRNDVSVGASNGPHTTVISGDVRAVEALLEELTEKEIYCRRIKVDVASHSAQVDPILGELLASLDGIRPQPAKIPMLSTVTSEYAFDGSNDGVVMDARYWVENLRRSVLFAPGIEKLAQEGCGIFVELSPHPILLPATEASARRVSPRASAVASLRREKPEGATLLAGLASLYVAGHKIDWAKVYSDDARCVRLPQYPFQRERCWPEPADAARMQRVWQSGDASPLLGRRFESSLQPGALVWETELEIAALPYLNDHRVLRSAVFPASGHVEMALAAARAARPGERFELRGAKFSNAVYLPDTGAKALQMALIPEGENAFRFELRGRADGAENDAWTLYSTGGIVAMSEGKTQVSEARPGAPAVLQVEELKQQYGIRRTREEQYERTSRSGLNYGPQFQLVEEVWVGEGECLCRVRCEVEDGGRYGMHPALLDACFQAMAHVRPELDAFKTEDTYLPVTMERVRMAGRIPETGDLYAHAALVASDAATGMLRANLRIADGEGNVLAEVDGMELMRVARESLEGAVEPLWTLDWVPQKAAQAEATVALLPRVSGENWIVFADGTGFADSLKNLCLAAGGRCTLVRRGNEFQKIADGEFEIRLEEQQDLKRLLEEISAQGVPTAVVHLWTLDNGTAIDAEAMIAAQTMGSQHVPAVVQAITAVNWGTPPRLWLVTAGAMTVESDRLPRMENAPLWGIGRSVAREHGELHATLVDLSAAPETKEVRALALEICAHGKEDRIVLRGDRRYVARLKNFSAAAPEEKAHALLGGENYRLEISSTGILDNIELRARKSSTPEAGEIAIEVIEAGLNFSDVTKVMGLYPGLIPGEPIPLGNEGVGRVIAVGEGVAGFRVGDEVIALTPSMRVLGLMESTVSIPAELAVHKPSRLSVQEAATVAVVYITAYWSLVDQARIRKGDWVLVHAGAGGVGLAAIEIAKWAGAKIIATVGSKEKEEYLRSLGVEHVLHSRSLDFVEGVMEITGGRGVDIVLNSLAGEFLLKSLEVLAPYGRFVEMGKRDIYEDKPLGLKVLRNNISFHVVDVAAAVEDRRWYVAEVLGKVMGHIEAGEWKPLPVTSFSSAEPSVPFRYMAQARHIGKISIRMDRDVQVLPAKDGKLFSPDASYLITGGLGGVALTVAEWMARNGAGHLVLLSRRAASAETDAVIRRMEEAGARVTTMRADVTRREDLDQVMEAIHASGWPLKGMMHTAAVVDDALIRDLRPERFLPVMAPKITGAWNLHEATRQEELDFFVLFSSIAAIHPQPGMGSYAAANAFLDAFAHALRAQGRPAVSVNWGGWDQIGLARAAGTGRSIEGYGNEGMRTFSGEEALEALRRALESNPVQMTAVPIDLDRFAKFHGVSDIPPLFSDLMAGMEKAVSSHHAEILEQLRAADAKERREILETYLQETLGRVLKLASHRIDRERLLGSMGLDSLMGLEFVRRLSNALEIAVPATVVFNYPTIQLLAAHLLRRMQMEPAEETASVVPLNEKSGAVGELAGDLSDEDALQALMGAGPRSS